MRIAIFAAACIVSLCGNAAAQEMAPIKHNGSLAIFTRDDRRHVEVRYEEPRPGLPVKKGMLIFEGTYDGRGHYAGMAFLFRAGCEPLPYPVIGKDDDGTIVLSGIAPRRAKTGCEVVGNDPSGSNSRLVFEFEPS